MLCPAVEGRTLLGAIFSSSLFPSRAPTGQVLITCFLGGARSPAIGRMDTDAVLPRVEADLRALLGVRERPTFVHHQRWARAIPQYELGHDAVVKGAARAESSLPGLYLAGQWRGGVAIGECIAQGRQVDRKGVDAVVQILPEQPAYPDATFIEDTAVIIPELAVLTRPGAPDRTGGQSCL